MAINFQPAKRINPLKPQDPAKYYANPVYKDKITMRKIATMIGTQTTISIPDTMAVLEALTQALPFFLIDGNIVYLGDYGTFRITLQSEGAATPEELTSANITGFRLLFRAGKEFAKKLKEMEATKV
ncbi:MAG: DNA-binding protein [Bacteroidetes bacterium]|nr:DNA-binding protein [Bacteroidota bacterium]